MAPSNSPDANIQTGVDMTSARSTSSVNVPQITHFLHGSSNIFNAKKDIVDILSNDPVFNKAERLYLSRSQRYYRGMAITKRLYELKELHSWTQQQTTLATSLVDESLPLTLHHVAFTPVLSNQSQGSLATNTVPLANSLGIFGAYLQTELGHGSNVAKIETTATYIPSTKEFEIHSPTLTSAKWWIGALGRTATHGVVQARLLLPSGSRQELKDFGPHLFLVQLRSQDTHQPLKGITLGDIGPKVFSGFAAVDNGYAVFDHVRIPKSQMLDKFSQVTDEGKYIKPPHSKLSYGGMLYIRSSMVTSAGWACAKAATIALRYTHVRRQGEPDPDNPGLELQVIRYPTVYYRLIPVLSRSYVWIILGRKLQESFNQMNTKLAKGDTSQLAEMHVATSGLKPLVTSQTISDLETSRRAMGGHGFSAYSGLGTVYADYLPSATFEGDNYVLDQQVVRAAVKSYQSIIENESWSTFEFTPLTRYLRHLVSPEFRFEQFFSAPSIDLWLCTPTGSPSPLVNILELRAALIVQSYGRTLKQEGTASIDASASTRVSRAVTDAFVAGQVAEVIDSLPFEGETKRVVRDVFILHLLTTIESGLVDILSFNLFDKGRTGDIGIDPTQSLRLAIKHLCQDLVQHSILLSDAFGFSDWELDSALGVHNGKVYEALMDKVKTEPLNTEGEVTPIYEATIKPMLFRGKKAAKL